MNFDKIIGFFIPKDINSNEKTIKQEKNKPKHTNKNFKEAYKTLSSSSKAEFLANQKIQNKNINTKTPLTPQDIENIKNEVSDFYKNISINEKEISNITNAITTNATKEIADKRLNKMKSLKNIYLQESIFDGNPNSTFILDNADKFEQIFNGENCRMMFADIYSLIEATDNEKTLNSLLKHSSDPIDFASNATNILYNTKEHKIAYGDEIVNVDSAFLVNLLSEYQDWRGYEEFNKMVENLTEKNHRNSGELNYYKLAEGILRQKPELYDIINLYTNYINQRCVDVDEETAIERKEIFFEDLDKSGLLRKNVALKTIVPDDNALTSPKKTCALMNEMGIC